MKGRVGKPRKPGITPGMRKKRIERRAKAMSRKKIPKKFWENFVPEGLSRRKTARKTAKNLVSNRMVRNANYILPFTAALKKTRMARNQKARLMRGESRIRKDNLEDMNHAHYLERMTFLSQKVLGEHKGKKFVFTLLEELRKKENKTPFGAT